MELSPPRNAPQGTLLLHALVQRQMLQLGLDLGTHLHQPMAMQQQLPLITLHFEGTQMRGKRFSSSRRQNVPRIAVIGLLPAHIAGTDLCRISDPKLMAQMLDQPLEPATSSLQTPYRSTQATPTHDKTVPPRLSACSNFNSRTSPVEVSKIATCW